MRAKNTRSLLSRLFAATLGLSSSAVFADDLPPPPSPVTNGNILTAMPRSGPGDCAPYFTAPATSDAQALLNEAAPSPAFTAPAPSTFGGGLQASTLLASSYAPSMLGDFFGMNSAAGGGLYMAHYDGYFDGLLSPAFDDTSASPYVGTGMGFLEVNNFTTGQSVGINNFTGDISTSTPQNSSSFPLVNNSAAVEQEVNRVAATQYGPGYTIPGWMEGGQDAQGDRFLFVDNDTFSGGWGYDYYMSIPTPGGTVAAAPGANIGRQKLSENASPIPRDRVFINYNYFNNTPLARGGVDVHRVTPGFEKTFFNGRASFEMRTPFATTLDSVVDLGGFTNTNNTEFGNMTMYMKALLYNNDAFAVSSGLGVAVPTADDFAFTQGGTTLVRVENQSVHLLPFVAVLYAPNERFFSQAMMQIDVDANGNPVSVSQFDGTNFTGNLTQIGRPYDYTYMYLDFNVGYWTYLAPNSGRFITGFAPMFEVHVNQTVGAASATRQVVDTVPWAFTSPSSLNSVNATVGASMIIRDSATLSLGYGTPIGGIDQFDGEFRLSFNWLFGKSKPTNPLLRPNTF